MSADMAGLQVEWLSSGLYQMHNACQEPICACVYIVLRASTAPQLCISAAIAHA